ncbi:MAG: NfeD family protein, partial [Oscillospiraceae bacterium]
MFDLTFMTYIWLAGIVLFSVVEVATVSLFSIWFIAGSLASCVVSIFAPSAIWAQIIVFIVVSFALLAFTRPFVMKRVMKKKTATNADMAIGKNALVTEAIKKDQHGRVKLD